MMEIHDPSLLAEMDLLFAPDSIVDVEGDAGWNCYAKAFIAMWLLRLWGEECNWFEGHLCIVDLSRSERIIRRVYPHAWAGLSEKRIVDMSVRNIGSLHSLTVVGGHVVEDNAWRVFVEKDSAKYDQIASGRISEVVQKFLVYRPVRISKFAAESINDARSTFSPSVSRTLSKYRENLLPKAVLHMFLFAEGSAASLGQNRTIPPWDQLERWEADACNELNSVLKRNGSTSR